MMNKKVLVTGANGFVGAHLVRELLAHGYEVSALHRPGSDLSSLEGLDVSLVAADIRDKPALLSVFGGHSCIFHIAALFRQAKNEDQVYWDVNLQGVQNVFEAAIATGVAKVIHCSTVGVHSHIPKPPADETEEHRPGDIYQETKSAGEKLASTFYQGGDIGGAIIRPAMIWGPEDQRTLKIFKGIKNRSLPLIEGRTYVHWILVNDLVRAFRLAAENDQIAAGEVFIISGEEAVSMRRFFAVIAQQFGVRPPKLALPALPFQVLGSLCELVCKPFGIEPPIYRRRVDFYTKTRWFDSSKAHELLSFKPTYSFEQEVEFIADWYKREGWI